MPSGSIISERRQTPTWPISPEVGNLYQNNPDINSTASKGNCLLGIFGVNCPFNTTFLLLKNKSIGFNPV